MSQRLGVGLVTAAALCWSSGGLIARLAGTDASTVLVRWHRGVYMPAAAALSAVLAALLAVGQATPWSARGTDLALLALFGIGQLGVGMLCFTAGARLIPVAEASLIGVLECVLGPVWVWLAIGERPGLYAIIGGAVILGALIVHTAADLLESRGPALSEVG